MKQHLDYSGSKNEIFREKVSQYSHKVLLRQRHPLNPRTRSSNNATSKSDSYDVCQQGSISLADHLLLI